MCALVDKITVMNVMMMMMIDDEFSIHSNGFMMH